MMSLEGMPIKGFISGSVLLGWDVRVAELPHQERANLGLISLSVGIQVDLDVSETTDFYIIFTVTIDQSNCAVRKQMGAFGRYLRASAESIFVDAGIIEDVVVKL